VTSVSMEATSAYFSELLEPLLQELGSWFVARMPWDEQLLFIAGLQPVTQHRTVDLFEDVRTDFDLQVGADAEYVPVERGMVDLAECEPVGHDRLTAGVTVRKDVGGVQELGVLEPTDGTRRAVGDQDLLAELGLVASAGDNAAMESFFSLLQGNVLDQRRWRSRSELSFEIVTWIERTYNRRRRQRGLGKLTPVEFELAFAERADLAA
jgi:hypothetical protein